MQTLTPFEILSLVIGVVGFGFVAWQIRQAGKQNQGQTYLAFTERFNVILEKHGRSLLDPTILNTGNDRADYSNFLSDYVSLVHQEFELQRANLIDKRIWSIWVAYFDVHAQNQAFRSWWLGHKGRFDPNPNFQQFVEGRMNEQ